MLLCVFTLFGQTTALKYKGGTYSFGEYGEGNSVAKIKIRPINAEKAVFCLDVEQSDSSFYNMGMILGVMKIKGTVGVYEKKDNDNMDCKLQFVFKGDQLAIATLDGRNKYGYSFADDMHPNYLYKLTNKNIPDWYISQESEMMPLIEAYASMVDPDYYYTPYDNALWAAGHVKSGSTIAENQIWYKNDSLNQVTVAANYGDYEYSVWLHFYKDQIPVDLIDHMKLLQEDGLPATLDQKKKDVPGFVDQAVNVDAQRPEFFESVQGVKLGDPKSKAIEMYGEPDQVANVKGYERLTWVFIGEQDFDPEVDAPDAKLAEDSQGFSVIQYYKDDKLVAQMLEELLM
jgi:hypothetical protein